METIMSKMKSIAEMQIDNCYGCGACEKVCPKSAISMKDVKGEGFLYPMIDAEKCVECGLCVKKCPSLERYNGDKSFNPQAFALKSNNSIAEKSSTVGVFSVFAEYIYSIGGWVCGAVYDDMFNVHHVLTNKLDVIQKMKKSKYVQSNLENVYVETKEKLENNEMVFFSGTPCQVAGLMSYLGKEYNNLFTMDVICHGVPSPGMWRKYLDENYDVTQIKNIDFRHKGAETWNASQFLKIEYTDGKEVVSNNASDLYYRHFLTDLGLRKSCGECKYAVCPRIGDISVGDWWGAPKVCPDIIDDKKISILLLNSFKGRKYYEKLKKRFELSKEISLEDALKSNRSTIKRHIHSKREIFFKNVKNMTFNEAVKKTLFADKNYDIIIFGPTSSNNYGAILTYYALYSFLKQQGYKVALGRKPSDEKRITETNSFFLRHAQSIYLAPSQYKHYAWMSDIVLLGSDQVWNYKLFKNNAFFLTFCEENTKKIAYASSYGMDYLTAYLEDQSRYPLHNKYMKRFDYISVREKDGIDISEREFNVKTEHVLDPVFLLDSSFYEDVSKDAVNRSEEPYLTSYFLKATKTYNNLLQYTSDYLNLKMVNMGTGDKPQIEEQSKKTVGGCCEDLSVEDWINNIKNSEFVVTDSFHCLCFSIIFRKKFVVIQKHWGLSRIVSLLEMLGLEERRIETFEEIKGKEYLFEKEIDYDAVHEKLNKKRLESLDWLNTAITSPKKVTISRNSETDNCLKKTKNIIEYFSKLKENIDDYVVMSCTNGLDGVQAPGMMTKEFFQNMMRSSEGIVEKVGENLLAEGSQMIIAKGNGGPNKRNLGIKFSEDGLRKIKEKVHSVYTISFDWETIANQGQFKIQLESDPWDNISDYIIIDSNNKSGHYENIYLSTNAVSGFASDGLQVRVDNMNGEVLVKNLKLEAGNRATRPWRNQTSIYGFGMIFDNENNYMNVSTTSMAKIKYSLENVEFLVEYQNEGYRGCSPISEVYIEKGGRRYIYPCEGKGTYFFVYSKKMKEVIDISFIKYDDYNMTLEHR